VTREREAVDRDAPDLDVLTGRPGPGPHRTTLVRDGREIATLPDLAPRPDRLLFVAPWPSPASVEAGHYGQDESSRTFWAQLRRAGIIPQYTSPAVADDALVAEGHGLTNVVPAPLDDRSADAADAAGIDAELRAGIGPLWQKIALWRPAAVVFVDRRVAVAAAGRDVAERYGQLAGVALGGRPCFVMPAADDPPEVVDQGLLILRNLLASLPRSTRS
jgi:hypothetical protein